MSTPSFVNTLVNQIASFLGKVIPANLGCCVFLFPKGANARHGYWFAQVTNCQLDEFIKVFEDYKRQNTKRSLARN